MEVPKLKGWTEFKSWGWFALAAATTIWTHLALAKGAFYPNLFDGSIFLLQIIYAARGLKPYVDYGFVYPPGPAWLFGQILHLRDIQTLLPAVSLFNLLLAAVGAILLARLTRTKRRFLSAAFLFCIGSIMPLVCMYFGFDPCPISMSCVTLLFLLSTVRRLGTFPKYLALTISVAISTLWRWDRAIGPVVLLLLGGFAFWMTASGSGRHKTRLRWMARHLLQAGFYRSRGLFRHS